MQTGEDIAMIEYLIAWAMVGLIVQYTIFYRTATKNHEKEILIGLLVEETDKL
jgi:hypothetical protein